VIDIPVFYLLNLLKSEVGKESGNYNISAKSGKYKNSLSYEAGTNSHHRQGVILSEIRDAFSVCMLRLMPSKVIKKDIKSNYKKI